MTAVQPNNDSISYYIFSFTADCGDHVVAINTAKIALQGDEWTRRVYFHHTGYA